MELTAFHQRAIGLDVHQAQIMACAMIHNAYLTAPIRRIQARSA